MIKKILVALLATLSLLAGGVVTATPANAHISTCTISAYNPEKIPSTRALRGKGRWYCESGSHHEYVASRVDIQYYSERIFWSDGWATLGMNRANSERLSGTVYALAPCANGARRYRTKYTLYMVGAHGVREKVKYSYGTSMNC